MVMKKLIVFSVVFALVAGAAFAEINVGGAVFGNVNVLEGSNLKDTDTLGANGGMGRLRLEGSGESEDGTFGGYIRFHGEGNESWGQTTGWGNAWWKPIDQLKLLIGSAGYDGFFAADGVARWGFYRDAGDVGIIPEGWIYSAAFYGGFTRGLILTITPLEAMSINIGVPIFDGGRAEAVYKQTNAQVSYAIDGIGDLAVTFEGSYEGPQDKLPRKPKVQFVPNSTATGDVSFDINEEYQPDPAEDDKERRYDANLKSKFYAYFNLSAIENLGLNIGVGFTLPAKEVNDTTPGQTITYTYQVPVAVGLGASYDAGAFGVKVRVQGEFAQSAKAEYAAPGVSQEYEFKGPFVLNADLLPSFAINDSMKVFLSAGLKLTGAYNVLSVDASGKKAEKEKDSVVGWHIQPYFTKSVGWCQAFYAGFRLESDGAKGGSGDGDTALVKWSVPLGVAFQF